MQPFWRRHLRRLRRHLLWISLAVAGQVLCRALLSPAVLRGTNEVGGSFLQVFGGMYGIIVAFAMYVVWQQHNDTQISVEREAVSLGELSRMLSWFTSWPHRDAVRAELHHYAIGVPQSAAEAGPVELSEQALLASALSEFLRYTPSGQEERLYEPTLGLFHELNEAREHRITLSRLRLPEGLRWFVFLGGGVSVTTLWLLWIESPVVHAVLTAAMTWVVVAAVSIVIDLDDPFSGDFVVDWRRFHDVARRMETIAGPPSTSTAPAAT